MLDISLTLRLAFMMKKNSDNNGGRSPIMLARGERPRLFFFISFELTGNNDSGDTSLELYDNAIVSH